MTKKDFIALAAKMQALKPSSNAPAVMAHWKLTCEALADFCAGQNPRFDRSRWLAAVEGK